MIKFICYIEKCIRNIGVKNSTPMSYTIERTCFHKNTDCPKLSKFVKKVKKD
jgi:hypothetical protein